MNPTGPEAIERREQFRKQLRKAISDLAGAGVWPADQYNNKRINVGQMRRRGGVHIVDPTTRTLTLIEDDNGVLLWEEGAILPMAAAGPKRGMPRSFRRGSVVDQLIIEPPEPNKVGDALAWADGKLTKSQGMRVWKGAELTAPNPAFKPANHGRILVVIHGTFSESAAILNQLSAPSNKAGNDFLGRAASIYDQILAFDHPTIAVSPMLNALEIARMFEGSKADVDIICHSRGGLVTRWWLEAFDKGEGSRRAILVGAPLAGTSLASPPRLRHVLSWFSNLNRALAAGAGMAASLIPFMTVVACLAKFTSMVSSVASKPPALDAAIAMIPGLAAMSLTSNNRELSQLNAGKQTRIEYFVIKSHYLPEDPGWKFWEYFVDPLKRAATVIFPGDTDLIVDSNCMSKFCKDVEPEDVYDFGGTSRVFHTNYFSQRETCENLAKWLKIS